MLRNLLDRVVLLAGVLGGGMLPAFFQQYRQRMAGRLDQARETLADWQRLADQMYGGDLAELVRHHQASGDATFQREASIIEAARDAVPALEQIVQSLQGGAWSQLFAILRSPRPEDLHAAWALYRPEFAMDPAGLSFALIVGGSLWLLWLGSVWLVLRGRKTRRSERRLFSH